MDSSAEKPRALVSANADFWLVGGASLAAFTVFILFTDMAGVQLGNRPFYWAFYLSFMVNDPHFAYSYLLFYRGFRARLAAPETERLSRLRLITAGLVVPIAMLCFLIFSTLYPDPAYLNAALVAMIFSVGWHYVKQGYGVLITLSLYEGVTYSAKEKRVLWINAYILWVYSWICGFIFGIHLLDPQGVQPQPHVAPTWFDKPALYGLVLTLPAAVTLIRHWLKTGGICANAVIGYACAVYMWIMMPFISPAFMALIPLFHSLQYLPFVYKMKRGEYAAAAGRTLARGVAFAVAGVVLGAVFIEALPKYLDQQAAAGGAELPADFFFLMFLSFINIHHYFMDSAYWRRDNDAVQRNLFRG